MTAVTAFVEGWDFVQTLGEGAYGEYVQNLTIVEHVDTYHVYSNAILLLTIF